MSSNASGAATASWVQGLDPAIRQKIRELHAAAPARNLLVLIFPALWVLMAWLVISFPGWPTRVAAYVVIGIAIHALLVFAHDGMHGNIARHRWFERWLAFLCAAPCLVSSAAYRTTHLIHHRYTREPEDPDEFANITSNKALLSVIWYYSIAAGTPFYLFALLPIKALQKGTRADRWRICVEYALLTAFVAGMLVAVTQQRWLGYVVHLWFIPWIVASVLSNVRAWAEHGLTRNDHPVTRTRTVTSNRLVSFLMLNVNYHLEHHLFPGVPWYNLPRLHELLKPEYDRHHASVYRSYLRFVGHAAASGVHGTTPV